MQNEVTDRSRIEAGWHSRGFSCGLWVDSPGQRWEDYVHATDELLMVLEGELDLEMQGRAFRPKPGDEVFNVGGMTARWLYGYKGN